MIYAQIAAIIGFFLIHYPPLEFEWLSSAVAMAIVLVVNFHIAINGPRLLHSTHQQNRVAGLCKL